MGNILVGLTEKLAQSNSEYTLLFCLPSINNSNLGYNNNLFIFHGIFWQQEICCYIPDVILHKNHYLQVLLF
jgi:hypothetical protein